MKWVVKKFSKGIGLTGFIRNGISEGMVGEGSLPWAIFGFRIFSNYFSQKFEKIKIKVCKCDDVTMYGIFRLDLY